MAFSTFFNKLGCSNVAELATPPQHAMSPPLCGEEPVRGSWDVKPMQKQPRVNSEWTMDVYEMHRQPRVNSAWKPELPHIMERQHPVNRSFDMALMRLGASTPANSPRRPRTASINHAKSAEVHINVAPTPRAKKPRQRRRVIHPKATHLAEGGFLL